MRKAAESQQEMKEKNKILQNTCHWEYSNIKGSIFNLYDGFCGVFKAVDNTEATQQFKYYNSKYYNGFSTDLNMTDINEIGYPYWCNAYKVQNLYEILCDMINDTPRYQNLFSTFSQNCVINNINYHAPAEGMQNIDVVMLQTDFDLISKDKLAVSCPSFSEKLVLPDIGSPLRSRSIKIEIKSAKVFTVRLLGVGISKLSKDSKDICSTSQNFTMISAGGSL